MLRRAHIDSPQTRQSSGIRYAVIAHSAFAGRSQGWVPESGDRAYMASRVKVRLPPSSFSVTTSSPSNQDRSGWIRSSPVAPGESGRWYVRGILRHLVIPLRHLEDGQAQRSPHPYHLLPVVEDADDPLAVADLRLEDLLLDHRVAAAVADAAA